MKKTLIYKNRNRIFSIRMLLITILLFTQCDGSKSLYLINDSFDIVTIKSIKSHNYLRQAPIESYNQRSLDIESRLRDSAFLPKLQIDYFQKVYDTKSSIKINGDTISFELKPGDSLRIANTDHIFFPGPIKEVSLEFNNLIVITDSDTYFLRSRKEILSRNRIKDIKMKKIIEWKNRSDNRKG